MTDLINKFLNLGFMIDSVLNIPLKNLIENKIDLGYFYRNRSAMNMYLDKYRAKVNLGQWKAIEDLTQEEKLFYWNEAKKITQDKEDAIKMSKVIYCIDNIISIKYYDTMIPQKKNDE